MGLLGSTKRPLCGVRAHHRMELCGDGYKKCVRCGTLARDGVPGEVRFWGHVQKTDHCWIWMAAINPDGYGKFHFRGRRRYAHHVAWELSGRKRPDYGNLQTIDHKCNNRRCVRLAHLRVLALAKNVARGTRKPFCKRGHPMKGENLYFYGLRGRKRRRCRKCMNLRGPQHLLTQR